MEEGNCKETWAWLDEELRLDSDSPLAISQSLWEDFSSNDGAVRSLFPVSHEDYVVSPSFSLEKTESSERGNSWDVVPDCSPSPFKRRCLLQLYGNENWENSAHYLPGVLEKTQVQFVDSSGQSLVNETSPPNSTWYIMAEESHSSADGALNKPTQNWMAGSLSDSDTSEVVEVYPHPIENKKSKLKTLRRSAESSCLLKAAEVEIGKPLLHLAQSKDAPEKIAIRRRLHTDLDQSLSKNGGSGPVLAYPFALVKPSGIQGDVTLQDINQRIKMGPSTVQNSAGNGSIRSSASLSGKSVLALTKIQTEGNGTITILRTRS
ncbi:hypothetical protein KP509_15G055700 [Ceratopteris richardii]|uniref:Uncharacterized protein n=1 Tax=Ceratopteris richardii TaxID=49495 RepID=A0A8T2T7A6_CERRI|nr:hypothetical protein KP509_15G055700 [Ceratopteris richardii]